ncbi:MAG: glycosyltransferase family 2 protein [Chloroflexi bacterium]|nr:glycosyltransferase family 2 protein [Chloroflexota bacterium]
MSRVDVVIPVYNEEKDLPTRVPQLWGYLQEHLLCPWNVVIADNGSTDSTLEIARNIAKRYQRVTYIRLEQKGRGRALRRAWLESSADILAYMDVDLSTGLEALQPLISAIEQEGFDIAIGSRLAPGAQIKRSFKREFTSRAYNLLIRAMFPTVTFRDAQCGFKALSQRAARELLPLVCNTNWFFDTELLLLAHRKGYRIKEIPVTWKEDPDSRVKVLRTAWEDIKGLLRLRLRRL